MAFIFGCVYITSQSESKHATSTNTNQIGDKESISPLIPVSLAILSTLCFTTSNSIGRFTIKNSGGSLTSQ